MSLFDGADGLYLWIVELGELPDYLGGYGDTKEGRKA